MRVAGQVGRDDRREPPGHQLPHRELLERQVEEHRVVLEEVEAVPGDLAAALEVDQVEGLADRDVVSGREVEGRGACRPCGAPGSRPRSCRPGRRGGSGWGCGRSLRFTSASSSLSRSSLEAGLGLEPCSLGDQLGPRCGVLLLGRCLGDLVLLAADRLDFLEHGFSLPFERLDLIDLEASMSAERSGSGSSA